MKKDNHNVKYNGLTGKTTLIIILCSMLFSIIFTAIQINLDYRRDLKKINDLFTMVEKSYLPTINYSLFYLDNQQVMLLLEGITNIPEFSFLEISEIHGNTSYIRYFSGIMPKTNYLKKEWRLSFIFKGEERELGTMKIYASLESIQSVRIQRFMTSLGLNLIKSLILGALIFITINRLVFRHLRDITSYISRIELDSPPGQTLILKRDKNPKIGNDELDDITAILNKMYGRISESYSIMTRALDDKETLLRELHHRTKNNMQIIHSMLALQAQRLSDNSDIQEILKETESRISAMSMVHTMLYRSNNLSEVNLNQYCSELIDKLVSSYNPHEKKIEYQTEIDNICIKIDESIQLGLILVELVTNSIKHAFTEQSAPIIRFSLKESDDSTLLIAYQDNGKGLSRSPSEAGGVTLGLRLLDSLATRQLRGSIDFPEGEGFTCIIRIPAESGSS